MNETDSVVLLQQVCVAARRMMQATVACAAIVGDEGTIGEFAAVGLDETSARDLRRAMESNGEQPARALFEGKGAVRGVNPGGDPAAIHLPPSHPPVHAYLFVPVASASRRYGWLALLDKAGTPTFSDEEVELASVLGSLTGAAYENARRTVSRASFQQFQELIDGSPGLIFVKDLDGRFVTLNRTFEQFCGLSREEVKGKTDYDLFPRDQADVFRKHDRSVAETGAPLQVEERVSFRGAARLYLSNKFPLHDEDGKVYAVCGISTDITERKQSEERLREMQKLESISILAGGIAHDFNNLLTGVIGTASLIQETLAADDPAAPLVNRIIQTGEQLAHLTGQMLAYAGKGRFVVEAFDLSTMVREVSELLRLSIPKEVTLHLELDHRLPAIEADRGQAQQILMNLVINAGEAIGNHNGLITVRTRSRTVDDRYIQSHAEAADLPPGQYVVLEVRDTGCGMDTAVKARIFEPFFSTKFTGRGLGLSAAAGIVRGHKGAIIVSSHPGQGSVFTVLLPAITQPDKSSAKAVTDAAQQSLGVVLVIDDDPVVREVVRMGLERHRYLVLEAEDGLTALHIFKRHPGRIDLAILDLGMPGMSGEEVLPELRKIRPEVKVLISSGYTARDTRTMSQSHQVSGFLQKPYTVARLAEMVRLALSESQ